MKEYYIMAVMTKQTGRIPTRIAWRKVGDEVVILDLTSSVYWSLNDTAGAIWRLLSEGKNEGEIAKALCEEYDIGMKAAVADVQRCIKELEKEELLSKQSRR